MKKIIKPKQHEESNYIDDFTGKNLGESAPVEITVKCGYGSSHDMEMYEFHCDDEFLEKLLKFFDENLHSGNISNGTHEIYHI